MKTKDNRIPPAGTKIVRRYHGKMLTVRVTDDGLIFRRKLFRSISGVAKSITGNETNGYKFFGLDDHQTG